MNGVDAAFAAGCEGAGGIGLRPWPLGAEATAAYDTLPFFPTCTQAPGEGGRAEAGVGGVTLEERAAFEGQAAGRAMERVPEYVVPR